MGRPTTPIAPERVVEHNDNENNSSSKTETQVVQESSKNQMDEILEGVDGITPLALTSTGASEASRFGYSSKMVSKWYRHQCQYQSCPERWAEHDNVDAEEAHLTQATQHVPIIHRHEFVNKHWVTNSINVQDASMRAVLDKVLAKYQDLDLEVENYTFAPPMMALVHRWEDLKAYYACATHVPLKNAASALIAFLAPLVASSVASQAQTKRTDKVSFPDLWQIFPPSSISKTTIYGAETVCRVIKYQKKPQTNSSPEGWAIHLEYVDWNGQETGWATTVVTIWDYNGHRRVTSLPVSPLSFARDEETIRAQMIERGRKFERLRGYHYMMSDGAKILLETAKPEQRPIAGKVCVDAYAYYRSCNIVRPKLRALSGSGEDEGKENGDTATKDGAQMEDGEFEAQYALPVDDSLAAKGPAERTETLVP
ncbi:hypothetical protein MN608_05247 [Microdochium nivale]|nr:hypothetical protein MN608_05247 [Microdochium nivale]